MSTVTRITAALVLCLALPASGAEPKLETEDQKTAYAIGLAIADSLQPYGLKPDEIEGLQAGLADGIMKRKTQVELKDYQTKIQEFGKKRQAVAAEAEKKEAEAFLKKMEGEKGAEKTASGLIYIPGKAGDGASPKATDVVKVNYHGTLRDGTVFDSSKDRGQPATFPLNRVIPCWTEGVQKLKVGGTAKLICPSSIAYGDRGAPPKILPGAALVFEVELLSIEAPAAAGAPPASGHP